VENRLSVTAVVPVYNVEKYITRCVDSLLAQDMPELEIILVDDGATDSSGRICDEYAMAHDCIHVIHKPNGGLSSARKAGWQQAKGKLIVFVDSDDYVDPSYITELSKPFGNSEVELSMCGNSTDTENSIVSSSLPYSESAIEHKRIASDYILPLLGAIDIPGAINIPGFVPLRMYRTAKLQESDFVSEREYFTEDIIMNILYATRIKGKIALIDKPLYHYCVNPGSLTLKYRNNAFTMLKACNSLCRELTESLDVKEEHRIRRLHSNLTSAVTYGVYNIGRMRDYRKFKDELKTIFDNEEVKELMEIGNWPRKATWHKIIYFAYRYRAYFLLYKLLKTRTTL
jgi:glycosyltransferase